MRHLFVLALFAIGCVTHPVGAPCIPEVVQEGGFRASEVYVETSSPGCETRLCLVRGLEGDPRPECSDASCAPEHEVREHVYCTTRCGSDDDCPAGFACGDLGAAGRLCVTEDFSARAP